MKRDHLMGFVPQEKLDPMGNALAYPGWRKTIERREASSKHKAQVVAEYKESVRINIFECGNHQNPDGSYTRTPEQQKQFEREQTRRAQHAANYGARLDMNGLPLARERNRLDPAQWDGGYLPPIHDVEAAFTDGRLSAEWRKEWLTLIEKRSLDRARRDFTFNGGNTL